MKKRVLFLSAGLCVAFCSLAETNVTTVSAASEVRTFRLQYASASEVAGQINQLMSREVGLKWDMLRSGVGVKNASAAVGVTYRHVPEGINSYRETITGGRNSGFGSETVFDLANQSKLQGLWANSSYFQGTINSTDMQLLLQAFDDDSDLKTFANPKIIVSSGKEATVDIEGQVAGGHPRIRDGWRGRPRGREGDGGRTRQL